MILTVSGDIFVTLTDWSLYCRHTVFSVMYKLYSYIVLAELQVLEDE